MKNLVVILVSLWACFSCGNKSGSGGSGIIGVWKEYRADPDDDYGLGSWKFNADGSGIYQIKGAFNTQQFSFMWKKLDSSTIQISMDGRLSELELNTNNGLLIENSPMVGSVVYKKQ